MNRVYNKPIVFFEGLSSRTTPESLKAYLSKQYQVRSTAISSIQGKNNRYTKIEFLDVENVNELMKNRPHRIDGVPVKVYRSVPSQGSFNENKGIKNLIISGIKNELNEFDLKSYFENYGKINYIDMNNEDKSCRIEFDDYDSVDHALLDKPHKIREVGVNIEKGDRNYTSIDQSKVMPQPELNTMSVTSDAHSRSNSFSTRNDHRRSYQSSDCTSKSSRDSSLSINDNNFNINERKKSTISYEENIAQSWNDVLDDKWEITKKAEKNNERVLLIRKKHDRKQLAIFKTYSHSKDYNIELQALKLLKDINNVSKLIENTSNKDELWIIMERAPGCTLEDFICQKYRNELGILDAIKLTQQLLKLIKHIHSKGTFYGNLKPSHIMIDWDFKKLPIEKAQLTLIDFSQAYTAADKIDSTTYLLNQFWYQPLSINVKEFPCNSTVDASSICAILLWLITKIVPQHEYGKLPHQQDDAEVEIERKINREVEIGRGNKSIDKEQLKMYLIDTFNIGFDYIHYQPWTINSLEVRLESICELLVFSNPDLLTTENIFQELFSIHHIPAPIFSSESYIYQDIFEKASKAFDKAKKLFSELSNNKYSWSDGTCNWLNNEYSTINERRHDDILTYYVCNQGTLRSYSIKITCFATISDEGNVITLYIGSPINGIMSRIPIGYYSKAQNYMIEFSTKFDKELINLLTSICKHRKAIQQ